MIAVVPGVHSGWQGMVQKLLITLVLLLARKLLCQEKPWLCKAMSMDGFRLQCTASSCCHVGLLSCQASGVPVPC